MYGEDASGKKVSLLNDNTPPSTSITTTAITSTATQRNPFFVRPHLPHRSRDSHSASSSSRSREGSNKSSRSSISCSPRQSPPTPPLVRLDSRSSIHTLTTPPPMAPQYSFDPMDQHGLHKNQQGGLPYYTNGYQQSSEADDGNPYPSMQDHHPQNYYPGMSAQQPLPSMYGNNMDHVYSQQATLQRLQSTTLPQYTTRPPINPLSQPASTNILPSLPALQSNLPGMTHSTNKASPSSATSTTSSALPTSTAPPIKTDPSTPITSSTKSTNPASVSKSASSTGTGTASTLPKKKYPCPHAKDYKCTDTFTTSGHAARHGKKHTGEKNVNCPTCGKAFTRKDNMKQHERTHKPGHTGRGSGGESPVIGKAGPRKRTMSASTMASMNSQPLPDDDEEDADGDLDMEVGEESVKSRPQMGKSKLSEILEQVVPQDTDMDADGEADGEGDLPGLDALAQVAAGERGH